MFWQRFEALCAGINKSPNAVAAELGLSNATTTAWKKGATPRAANLQRIAKYFGITVSEILGETKSPTPTNGGEAVDVAELNRILSVLDSPAIAELLAHAHTLEALHEARGNDPKSP